MARASARTTHADAHDDVRHSAPANGDDGESLANNDEEAIRAKLRESGWEKKTRKEKDDDAPSLRKNSDAKDSDRDHDRERRRGSGSGSARKERRSRSRRRGGDRDRDDRRDRDRDSRRHRDRSAKRGKPSSRRRSSRSRSNSKSRSRSPSRSRRVSSSHKRRGASPSRSASRGRGSGSKKSRAHASKSRSPETSQKKKKDEADTDTDPEVEEQRSESAEQGKASEKAAGVAEKDTAEDMEVDEETAEKRPTEAEEGEKSKERASSAQRKGRKSSRHSRSKSRSPSRSSRRRRHRSRSRSPSRNSRRRRSSRSRSRSRGRRGSDRRRRRSYTRSRSPSHSRRRRRSSSKDKKRRDANSSPEPHEHPPGVPGVPVAPPLPIPAPVVNPTITQLMQQYPTMSLQDIIAKMQASNVTMAAAVSQKPARELYVGNLPPNVTGPQLQEFLGTIIQQVGLCAQPGNPILNTWISTDGHFAFCEMRSVEECNLALLLNQLSLLGQPLKFGRPRSFMGPPQPMPVVSSRTQTALVNLGCTPNPVWFAQPNLGATGLGAAPALPIPSMPAAPLPNPYLANPVSAPTAPAPISAALLSSLPADANSKRLLMSNIPVVLVESQVKELVEPFGELKSFTLLMDKITGASTGNALFEYEDDSVAEEALQGLNGLDIGGIPLSVRRAPQDANGLLPADETSVVVKLANMVSLDELKDDEEFSDLKEDVEEECKRFGKVVDMVIPRPQDGESVPGVGNIYVRFNEKPEAAGAMKALSGRKFGGNIVKVTYYPLAKFESKEFA